MSRIRFGLIGYGAWGAHHARVISTTPGASLAAICARSAATRKQAQGDHPEANLYDDYRAMLANERLDAADVVLPSHLHYEAAREVLESGRHLLLEKPMALRIDHCTQLIELAKRRDRILAVGHELRLSSLWGKVKQLVDAGAIGEPLYALVELWRRPYRLGSDGWRYDIARVGDWILEEPIHFFDLARWYFANLGNPRSVYAQANGKRPADPRLHDNFSALVSFPKGAYAVVAQTLSGWEHHQVVKLTGTSGALVAGWSGASDRTFEPTFSLEIQEHERVVDVPIASMSGEVYELCQQLAMFVEAIRQRRQPACTGEDGRWSVAMCLAARESLEQGRVVEFDAP